MAKPLNLASKPICLFCKHYKGLLRCSAYPGGIPNDIVEETVLHDRVFDDQKGEDVFVFDEDSRHVKIEEVCRGIVLSKSSGNNTGSS